MPALTFDESLPLPTAPTVVGPTTKSATRPEDPLPDYLSADAKCTLREDFDAAHHLNFEPPARTISMKDLGLGGQGVSPVAVSDPFPLFSVEAIQQIRAEVFSDEVLQDCQFTSTFSKYMVRGMGPARAPFTYAAWKSPELVSYVSGVAGIDLIPSIDFEIATINISVSDGTQPSANDFDDAANRDVSAFAWHYDSFPFVCVVMLSDCTDMVGGETAIRMPNNEMMKVRGPAMGTAVVMQGRYIEHQALKALGGRERISMVTCFRPRSPQIKDETVLTGVRGISHKSELYTQYTEYRLELLEERIRAMLRSERGRQVAKKAFNVGKMREWLLEQRRYIDSMVEELV